MKRFDNNGKAVWGASRHDSYPTYRFGGRTQRAGRRDGGGFNRPIMDEGDGEPRQPEDTRREDKGPTNLNQVLGRLERLEKLGSGRFDSDRHVVNLESSWPRDTEPPSGFDEGDEGEYDEPRRQRSGGKFGRDGYPTYGSREGQHDSRPRRDNWDRNGPVWTTQGNRNTKHTFGGFNQAYDRPTTCWDPPQRSQGSALGFERHQRVKMDPPRFNGSDAANWISRVQYYFDHLMIPDAQRLHYAIMLFDPPASEWVFNYGANIECVTWQEFLEDVRHSFDRQGNRYRREGRNDRGSCWDPPRYQQHRQQIGGYDQQFNRPATCYDQPQSWQPSCWEPSRGYSDYDQPHVSREYSDSSYVPPRQYKTSTIRQPTYSSDVPPRNPPERDHLKLFDSDDISSDDDLSKIEINQEFAKNKRREENAKDETVDMESSEEVRLRSLKRPVEAISDEKSDPVAADSVKSEGKTEETCHGNDGEILGSDGQKDGEMHHDDSGVEKKSIGEKDVCAAENTNLIPNESENRSDKIDDAKVEPKDQTDDVSHAGPESVHEKSFENRAGKTEANKGRGLDVEVNDEAEETVQSKMGRVQTYVKARCVFDPGGDASLKLLLATLVVGLWFPP